MNIDNIGHYDNNKSKFNNSISNKTNETNEDYFQNYEDPSKSQLKDFVNNFKEEDAMKILLDKLKSFKEDFLEGEVENEINATHISDKQNMKEYPF